MVLNTVRYCFFLIALLVLSSVVAFWIYPHYTNFKPLISVRYVTNEGSYMGLLMTTTESVGRNVPTATESFVRETQKVIGRNASIHIRIHKECHATGDDALPRCPFCVQKSEVDNSSVRVFIENYDALANPGMYGISFSNAVNNASETCRTSFGGSCVMLTDISDASSADVVFRMQWFHNPTKHKVRYCYPQIMSFLNTEKEGALFWTRPITKHAEISINSHLSADIIFHEGCQKQYTSYINSYKPVQPDSRQGAIVMLSDCHAADRQWRTDYIKKLMTFVHIDSHGQCFHNVQDKEDRFAHNWKETAVVKLSKYRVAVMFENAVEEGYISEKIFLAYAAGCVPVYMGAPDIHYWVPGNHSYVDASQFEGPEKLAEHIKKILTDDKVYKTYISNLEIDRLKEFQRKHCTKSQYLCELCRKAYWLKKESFEKGSRPCHCNT